MEQKRTAPVADEDRARLRRLIDAVGERRTGEQLGMPRATLARALSGLTMRRGTRLELTAKLRELEGVGG